MKTFEPLEPRTMLSASTFGDFNADGFVDAADYVAWRMNPVEGGYEAWAANYGRELNWFHTDIADEALAELGGNLYADGVIDRSDMLALFDSTQDGGTVDGTELADLLAIARRDELFTDADWLQSLASYVVAGTPANANYQGSPLGNLHADSTAEQLTQLVNKWFLGLDRPQASGTYQEAAGVLFVDGPQFTDVRQGTVGDCSLMASLAETAFREPDTIAAMFVDHGDGTYTVAWHGPTDVYYVTVDSWLPVAAGKFIYGNYNHLADDAANELWPALAEKAYAQLNEFGWSRAGFAGSGQNSYAAIDSGYIYAALSHITGQPVSPFNFVAGTNAWQSFVAAYQAGELIGFATYSTPQLPNVVSNHAYAVVGVDIDAQTVTLFNPWGIEHGLLTLQWSQLTGSFMYFDRTATGSFT